MSTALTAHDLDTLHSEGTVDVALDGAGNRLKERRPCEKSARQLGRSGSEWRQREEKIRTSTAGLELRKGKGKDQRRSKEDEGTWREKRTFVSAV
jgi:hypothetical protein